MKYDSVGLCIATVGMTFLALHFGSYCAGFGALVMLMVLVKSYENS